MDMTVDYTTGEIKYGPQHDAHIGRQILANLKKNESKLLQIEIESGESETHGAYRLRSIRLAQSLKKRGLKKDDLVMTCTRNYNDGGMLTISSMYIGTTPLNVAPGMKYAEALHIMKHAKPAIIFSDPDNVAIFKETCSDLDIKCEIIVFGHVEGYQSFSDMIQPTGTEEYFECDDFDPGTTVAFATCSSGTTGLPKIVCTTHSNVIMQFLAPPFLQKDVCMSKGGLYLNISPYLWVTGIINLVGTSLFGSTRLHCNKGFSVEMFKYAVEKYRPTITFLSFSSLMSIVNHEDFEKIDWSSFERVFYTGSIVGKPVLEKLQSRLPTKLIMAYGSSESGIMSVNPGSERGSVGKLYPWCQWKVSDIDTDEKLGPNQTGELRLKSPFMFQTYLNNPEYMKHAFDYEGFYKTGDLVQYDEDGHIYVKDRVKEVMKCFGYQVSASEIENTINSMSGVIRSAVIGVPHPMGEIPKAFVEKEKDSNITEQQIKDYIKDTLSDFKQLRGGVVFIDQLPSTHSGKLNKTALKSM